MAPSSAACWRWTSPGGVEPPQHVARLQPECGVERRATVAELEALVAVVAVDDDSGAPGAVVVDGGRDAGREPPHGQRRPGPGVSVAMTAARPSRCDAARASATSSVGARSRSRRAAIAGRARLERRGEHTVRAADGDEGTVGQGVDRHVLPPGGRAVDQEGVGSDLTVSGRRQGHLPRRHRVRVVAAERAGPQRAPQVPRRLGMGGVEPPQRILDPGGDGGAGPLRARPRGAGRPPRPTAADSSATSRSRSAVRLVDRAVSPAASAASRAASSSATRRR